jgi:hypothetical protein
MFRIAMEILLDIMNSAVTFCGKYLLTKSVTLITWHPSVHKTLALTSPTSGGRSVSIVRSRTQATESAVQ